MIDQQIQIFVSQDGKAQPEVALERDTVWLSQGQMATLFDTTADNISLHLKNIYQEEELSESATTEDSSVVRQEGKRNVHRQIKHYNLGAIVSVGDRVSSKRATQFRQWATRVLKDHLTHGYSVNQRRLIERGQPRCSSIVFSGQEPCTGTVGSRKPAGPEGPDDPAD